MSEAPETNNAADGGSRSNGGLAACPCGKVPDELAIMDGGQGSKWAFASGSCCGEWHIEFRTNYHALDSDACKKLAREAWNGTPRAANGEVRGASRPAGEASSREAATSTVVLCGADLEE